MDTNRYGTTRDPCCPQWLPRQLPPDRCSSKTIEADVDREAHVPSVDDILRTMQAAPAISGGPVPPVPQLDDGLLPEINYLEREFRNRSLGAAGEQFVVNYERARLALAGQENLVENVEWVSRTTRRCGLDMTFLSFEKSGQERFIEVKTTRYGKQTPFFVSPNELQFLRASSEGFSTVSRVHVSIGSEDVCAEGRHREPLPPESKRIPGDIALRPLVWSATRSFPACRSPTFIPQRSSAAAVARILQLHQ